MLEILPRASFPGRRVKFLGNYTYNNYICFVLTQVYDIRICLNKCTAYISLESEVKICFL
jgi:hypothetical protein